MRIPENQVVVHFEFPCELGRVFSANSAVKGCCSCGQQKTLTAEFAKESHGVRGEIQSEPLPKITIPCHPEPWQSHCEGPYDRKEYRCSREDCPRCLHPERARTPHQYSPLT